MRGEYTASMGKLQSDWLSCPLLWVFSLYGITGFCLRNAKNGVFTALVCLIIQGHKRRLSHVLVCRPLGLLSCGDPAGFSAREVRQSEKKLAF